MQRFPDIFVRVAPGTYGLRDWGLTRVPFIKDFLVQEIRSAGGRAHVHDLVELASRRYGFKATSVSMTLSMNPQLFRDLGGGTYGLT